MIDGADVRLVDAHAKGDGRHDDAGVARHERALCIGAEFGRQAGVIGAGGEAAFGEKGRDFLGRFLAGDVNDGGPIDGA